MKTVYVDNNATTKVAPEVLEVMLPYFSEYYGNPSSMHFFGGQVQKKVDEARAKVADFLGAEPSEIVFTSCGTESDNAAILGTLDSYPEKRHLITTRVEHLFSFSPRRTQPFLFLANAWFLQRSIDPSQRESGRWFDSPIDSSDTPSLPT